MQAGSGSIVRIQRAVARYIAHARKALAAPALDDDAVHAARKDLKRARSGLRLLRPLSESAYRRENTRLRNAARRLSPVRDDKVLLARLTELIAEEKRPVRRQLLLQARKDVRNARRRDWRALRSAEELERIDEALATAAKRVRKWPSPPEAPGDAAPQLAVERLYRKGRKALKRSRKDPSDECLHEARKQTKHLAQALEIVAGAKPPKKAAKVLERADDLGDWLGDDHDLAVVESRCLSLPADADKPKRKIARRLEKRRAKLQDKALDTGRKLFRGKTKRVLESISLAA
jgi:CHAD domain-containing protein